MLNGPTVRSRRAIVDSGTSSRLRRVDIELTDVVLIALVLGHGPMTTQYSLVGV